MGPLTPVYRIKLYNSWLENINKHGKDLKIRENYKFLEIMGDVLELNEWS